MRPEALRSEVIRRAQDLGLDAEGVLFFRVPPQAMYALGSYGAFDRYGHWSRGKAYQRLRLQADLGLQRIYEVILRGEPPQAFVLEGNRPIEDLAVLAHVLGHADFFRHSLVLGLAQPAPSRRFLLHRRRIDEYRARYGQKAVEETLDRALLVEAHSAAVGPEDVLGTMAGHGALQDWQRDCLFIVRDEALHFRAQERTKILNEGWATFWHLRILRSVDLEPWDFLDVAALHSQIVAVSPGRLNPYALGLSILEEIASSHGADPVHPPQGEALEALRAVRDCEDDVALIRNHLRQSVVDRLQLRVEVEGSVSQGVEDVRRALLQAVGGAARPQIEVEQADPGLTLRLAHRHDGRDLDLPEAEAVLGEIQTLWGAPVQLETIAGGQRLVLRHDGQRATRSG